VWRPTQFRQTPNRIRGGRIGMASDAARYSRLTPRTCGATGGRNAGPVGRAQSGTAGTVLRDGESGSCCRGFSWQWQGRSALPASRRPDSAAQSGHPPAGSTAAAAADGMWPAATLEQHGWSQAWQSALGVTCATTAAHAAKPQTSCLRLWITAATPHAYFHPTQQGSCQFATDARVAAFSAIADAPGSLDRRRQSVPPESRPQGWPQECSGATVCLWAAGKPLRFAAG